MKRISLLLALLILVAMKGNASAHVILTDQTNKSGMIMHMTPDDNPVAGEPANLYFYLKDKNLSTDNYIYELFIYDNKDNLNQGFLHNAGAFSVIATYTFPAQGAYRLELRATPYNEDNQMPPVTFAFTQAVTRGVKSSALDEPRFAWAEFGLVFSLCGMLVLLTVVTNRRRKILGFTKW